MRDLADTDRPAADALLTASAFERRADLLHFWGSADAFPDGSLRHHLLGLDGVAGELAGLAWLWHQRPERARVEIVVAPGDRRRGLGTSLLRAVEGRLTEPGTLLQARADEQRRDAERFLQSHGFRETHRMVRLRLDLNGDRDLPNNRAPQLAAAGVEILSLTEARAIDPDLEPRLARLFGAARAGWPDPYGADPSPDSDPGALERAAEAAADHAAHSGEGFFIARCGESYLGLSMLMESVEDGVARQGTTAVIPEYRRRGIATALKLATLGWARRQGFRAILTQTANPGMLALNERLGFRKTGAEVRYVKRLGPPATDP